MGPLSAQRSGLVHIRQRGLETKPAEDRGWETGQTARHPFVGHKSCAARSIVLLSQSIVL
jgi:hypothetical protein